MKILAVSLIVFGVLVIAVAIWIARRGRPKKGSRSATRGVPTFRILALGLNGAGKTVLLASQFNKLCEPVDDRRYFLDGDWKQDTQLSQIYASVGDTSAPWPAGTRIGETREFIFDCKAFGEVGEDRPVFRISYLDYAGELLEGHPDEHTARSELEERVGEAHALLVIIDGREVLRLLRGEQNGSDYFNRVRPLLGVARRARCPVQLVLTKWDLVRTFSDSSDEELLRQVRARVMGNGHVTALVRAHDHQRRVRLIPVSAVGPQFAELREDGKVVKLEDGTLDPLHVDVPLSAVLPDALEQVGLSLDPAVRTRLEADIRRRVRAFVDITAVATSVLGGHAGMLLRGALRGGLGDELARVFVEMLVRREARASNGSPEDREAETQQLRTEVIEHMQHVMLLFEARLPSSTLTSRR